MANADADLLALKGATREVALRLSRRRLSAFDSASDDARALVLAACDIDAAALLRAPDALLSAQEGGRLAAWLGRRRAGEPISRILGRRAFWTCDLAVRPGVLDPRPDSEALIRLALRLNVAASARRLLDLGSGSGALLCALLSEAPQAFGVAVDLSAPACAATVANLAANGFAARSAVLRGAWASALTGRFDIVASNPPYIPREQLKTLDKSVRDHDPALALDGGLDGLDPYRALLGDVARLLTPGGLALFEIGAGAAAAVGDIARKAGLEARGAESDYGGHVRALAFAAGGGG